MFKTFLGKTSTNFGVKILIYFASTINSGSYSEIFAIILSSCSSLLNPSALMQVKDLLQKLYDEGITAEMTDSEQNGKLFKKAIKKFETIETRASGK